MKTGSILLISVIALVLSLNLASAYRQPDYYEDDGYYPTQFSKTYMEETYNKNIYKSYVYPKYQKKYFPHYDDYVKYPVKKYPPYSPKPRFYFKDAFDSFYSPDYQVPANRLSEYMMFGSAYQEPYFRY